MKYAIPAKHAAPSVETSKTPSFFSRLSREERQAPFVSDNPQNPASTDRPNPPLPAAVQPVERFSSTRSLGALTADLLKPKLRQWVDQKLEGVVERLIREEIKRLAGN